VIRGQNCALRATVAFSEPALTGETAAHRSTGITSGSLEADENPPNAKAAIPMSAMEKWRLGARASGSPAHRFDQRIKQ
jgi:hypothetical protein